MRSVFIALCSVLLFACKKEEVAANNFSEASYQLTFTGLWTNPQLAVPPSAHFTFFSGMVHNNKASLWQEGQPSSPGIEAVAETGSQYPLFTEVDSMIAKKSAMAQINIPPCPPNGFISRTVYCNSHFSYFSFASMIAPSPDWFIGVTNLNLYRNDQWLADTTIQLYVYDAGTEEGDVFAYNNPATLPQQPIQLLTSAKGTVLANGNPSLAPIARLRITKQ